MNTPMITIRLSAGLRTIAGAKTIALHTGPHTTAGEVLRALWDANPALAARIITPQGTLAEGILMIVRGKHIDFQQGLETPIAPGDEVLIVPPLSGG